MGQPAVYVLPVHPVGIAIDDGDDRQLFSDYTLDSLYRNHLEYFGKVLSDSNALVVEGFWRAPDAQAVV